MDDLAIRLGVHELIGAYVDCIDEDRLEDWPGLFADPCKYLIISRANHAAGVRAAGRLDISNPLEARRSGRVPVAYERTVEYSLSNCLSAATGTGLTTWRLKPAAARRSSSWSKPERAISTLCSRPSSFRIRSATS